MIFAAWFRVGNVWNFCCNAVEVVEIDINLCFVSNCKQVQHRIRASTECIHHGDGIFECLLCHDVACVNSLHCKVHHCCACALCIAFATLVNCRWRSGARKTHAKRFSNGAHGVGSKHSAACTFTRARCTFNFAKLFLRHRSSGARTNGFKHCGDVDVFSVMHARHG